MPVDYSKAKIYKIVDLETDECYIGSTCQATLANRLSGHVRNYKRYKKGKSNNVTSFKIIENDNYDIQLIENFPCDSKDELHAREGYWIRKTDCVNRNISGRTIDEWKIDNKDKIRERQKRYRNDNKAKICEYREKNKGKTKEYKKEYCQKNRDKLTEKVDCECGSSVRKCDLSRHKKSTKHKNFINN